MSMPQFIAANPTFQPAVVYDRFWMATFVMHAPVVGGDGTGHVTLQPYASETGAAGGEQVSFTVENILSQAATDPELANAVQALLIAVRKSAIARGLMVAE